MISQRSKNVYFNETNISKAGIVGKAVKNIFY